MPSTPSDNRCFGVLWMKDAFDNQRPFPAVAILLHFVPGKSAPLFAQRKRDDLVERGVLADIGPQISEARDAMGPKRHCPARRSRDLHHDAGINVEGAGDARCHFTRPGGADRHIKRQDQGLAADGLGATNQIETDGMIVVGQAIELEPEHIRRDRGDLFDRGAARGAEHVRNTGTLRSARQMLVAARPNDRRPAHGGHPDRR